MLNKRHILIFSLFFIIIPVLLAADEPVLKQHDTAVTINLTKDLISFFKMAVWIFGIFIAILAFLGIAFFGFDVRKARAAIQDSLKEIREINEQANVLKDAIQSTYKELEDLKDKFNRNADDAENSIQELGAQVEELTDVSYEKSDKADQSISETDVEERTDQDLIVEIITNSRFKWTTIKRLMNKTGLSKDEILGSARKNPKIEIAIGKRAKDHIFRLKGITT